MAEDDIHSLVGITPRRLAELEEKADMFTMLLNDRIRIAKGPKTGMWKAWLLDSTEMHTSRDPVDAIRKAIAAAR